MEQEKRKQYAQTPAEHAGDTVEYLILAYRPLVYALARKLQPLDPLDEDLLQCGLIGLWRAAERWDGVRPFAPLARHCSRSEMADYLRRKAKQSKTVSLDSPAESLFYQEDWSKLELADGAERACPPGSRARAAVLALADGVSLSQTAKALGVRRARAKAIARRAYLKINQEET